MELLMKELVGRDELDEGAPETGVLDVVDPLGIEELWGTDGEVYERLCDRLELDGDKDKVFCDEVELVVAVRRV
jgi:hypothetical protein